MFTGVIIGAMSFLIIGIFHPIVIKAEYYFSYRIWPLFLFGGVVLCAVSLFIESVILSSVVAIAGFSMLWSIKELKEQDLRVKKGWFPSNPNRKKPSDEAEEYEINVQRT